MGFRTLEYADFSLHVPGDWSDITDAVDAGSPMTLALPDGVGALQFSVATYAAGRLPNLTSSDLDDLLTDFASARGLGQGHDRVREEGALALAAATFAEPDATMRVWYVSDGRSVAKVTYTCISALRPNELRDCEAIVRSIEWHER